MKYLIVGGVAGGATAAARIRRNTEKDEIILFEKGDHISYANCGLPYYVGGVIADRDRLFVQTPEAFGRRFRIDVRVRQEVTRVDPATRTVTVRRADGSTYTETYDKLLLSPGSSPVRPPLPGVESEGIFTLRNVEDTDRIKAYTERPDVRRAVVVGGGFIGLEAAENLVHLGKEVHLYQLLPQVLPAYDPEVVAYVHHELRGNGVRLHLGAEVQGFAEESGRLTVKTKEGDDRAFGIEVKRKDLVYEPSKGCDIDVERPRNDFVQGSLLEVGAPKKGWRHDVFFFDEERCNDGSFPYIVDELPNDFVAFRWSLQEDEIALLEKSSMFFVKVNLGGHFLALEGSELLA